MNYTDINFSNLYNVYFELLRSNWVFLFFNFYAFMFVAMHYMVKCCKCFGLIDEHIQETIVDEVSSDEVLSNEVSSNETSENLTEEYTDEIVQADDDSIDMVVRYEKLYNIVDYIIEGYVPIKKYREKIPTDFMSEHDLNVYGTIYEWGSFCQSMNKFELDYFLENLVTYVGQMDGRFKRYLKKHRSEIENDYHHFLLNINNLNKTTLFTPDYDE